MEGFLGAVLGRSVPLAEERRWAQEADGIVERRGFPGVVDSSESAKGGCCENGRVARSRHLHRVRDLD